jgi:hypothetical protein
MHRRLFLTLSVSALAFGRMGRAESLGVPRAGAAGLERLMDGFPAQPGIIPVDSEGPVIRPVLSSRESDAQANTAALQEAFAQAVSNYAATGIKSTVDTAIEGEVPFAPPLLIPNEGNFIWQSSRGTVFRPNAINVRGFIQPAERAEQVIGIVVRDLTIDPLTNPDDYQQDDQNGGVNLIPGGTRPYAGSGWTGRYKNSWLENIRIERYFDDQAFIYGVENCTVSNPYWFNDDLVSSSGGHRLFEAIDSLIYNACGTSPDDGQQFCPVDGLGATFFNLKCRNSYYIGGNVTSTVGRAMVIISDDNCTHDIENCGFIGVEGKGCGGQIRVLAFGAGAIINPVFRDITLDGSGAILTPYGQRFEIRMSGDIRNPTMNIRERNLQATFFQIQDWTMAVAPFTTSRPSGGLIDIAADPPARDRIADNSGVLQPFNVVEISHADNLRMRIDIGGSQLADAVSISDCTNLTLEVLNVSATPAGFAHVRQNAATRGTRILAGNLTGAGSNFALPGVDPADFLFTDLRRAGALIPAGDLSP